MKALFNKLVLSFENSPGGFSARKLTAFVTMVLIVYCHFKYVRPENVVEVIIIDCCFISLLLGIVTVEQIIKFKNGGSAEPKNKEDLQ